MTFRPDESAPRLGIGDLGMDRETGVISAIADALLDGVNPEIAEQVTRAWRENYHSYQHRKVDLALLFLRGAYAFLGRAGMIDAIERLERGVEVTRPSDER